MYIYTYIYIYVCVYKCSSPSNKLHDRYCIYWISAEIFPAHLPAFHPAEALEWWEESFTKDTVDSRLDFKAAEPVMSMSPRQMDWPYRVSYSEVTHVIYYEIDT